MFHSAETLSRSELRALQDERVRETVRAAYENVAFYRRRLDEAGVSPSTVRGVADLRNLPFTTGPDLRAEYPNGLFAVPRASVRRVHTSSGTTGKPKVFGYTASDLDAWAGVVARSLHAAGFDAGDTVQNAAKHGLVTGGMGWHDGIEALGATVVPSSTAGVERQVELARDLDATGLVCFPSFALEMAEVVERAGRDPADLAVSKVTVGGEPTSPELRAEIADAYDATVVEHYGLSELFGAGIATECAECLDGKHVWEDHIYPEVVDPDTGERVGEGVDGELVLTSLTKEAMPLLRYRTGDLARLTTEPCDCGRSHARIEVTERLRNELSVGGRTVYPTEIESAVLSVPGTAPYYRVDVAGTGDDARIEVTVEREPGYDGDADALADGVRERCGDRLSLVPDEVAVAAPRALDRADGAKADRVYDHR